MNSRILVPFSLFVAGLGIGGWAGHQQRVGNGGVGEATGVPRVAGKAPVASGGEGAKLSSVGRAGGGGDLLDELADDYSPKRAQRYADSLSVTRLQAALETLATRPGSAANNSMRGDLMRAWARQSSQDAWQYALSASKASDRARLLGAVAGEIAKTDPSGALKLALSLAPVLREQVLGDIFRDWTRVNPEEATAYLNQHPELPVGGFAQSSSLMELATTDPARAARLALTCRTGEAFSLPITGVMNAWIEANPAEAKNWIEGLTDPVARDTALRAFASSRTLNSPKLAMELSSQLSSSEDRIDVQRKVLGSWIKSDGAAAMAYVSSMGESEAMGGKSSWIGYEMGSLTPDEQRGLLAQLPESKVKSGIVESLVRRDTANGKYAQAAALLTDMADSPDRDRALHGLAQGWSKADSNTFSTWLNQQSDSSDRDLMVAGYCSTLANSDPQSAIKWAQTIPDKSVQLTTLKNIAVCWSIADAAKAQAWMSSVSEFTPGDTRTIEMMAKIGRFLPMSPVVKMKR